MYDLTDGDEPPIAEVAAWRGQNSKPRRINASGHRSVWCHWLDEKDYLSVRDGTHYGHA